MSELNMSLEYIPLEKNLKDTSSLKSKDVLLKRIGQDKYDNPRFQVSPNVTCTIQTTRDGNKYVAFVRVSKFIQNNNRDGSHSENYENSYYKAFAARNVYGDEESDDHVYFENFREWIKSEELDRWVPKDQSKSKSESNTNNYWRSKI